jgi:hypothetical protein
MILTSQDCEMGDAVRKRWDFFVSYASQDRETAAKPVAEALTNRGFAVWLDRWIISADLSRLQDQIQHGLSECHYGIVIVSPWFLQKDWPMRELDTILAIETIEGRRRIVPVLHNLTEAELRERAPELHNKKPIGTADGFERACDQILERVVAMTDRERRVTLGESGAAELPRFRAPGVVRCQNAGCSWRVPDE